MANISYYRQTSITLRKATIACTKWGVPGSQKLMAVATGTFFFSNSVLKNYIFWGVVVSIALLIKRIHKKKVGRFL